METTSLPKVDEIVKLSAEQILSIKLDKTARQYDANSSRAGQEYFIGNYMGVGMSIESGDMPLFEQGDVAELSLQFTKYQRPNKQDPTKLDDRNGWRIVSFVTWEQMIKAEGNKAKLDQIREENRVRLLTIEKKAMAEINQNTFSEDKFAELLKAAGAAGAKEALAAKADS